MAHLRLALRRLQLVPQRGDLGGGVGGGLGGRRGALLLCRP